MIKNRFPKRKTQSIDGINDFLPKAYEQDFEILYKQHDETIKTLQEENQQMKEQNVDLKEQNEDLAKNLQVALEREGLEGDRNVNLEAHILELTDQKETFEKVLLSQEQMIKSLNLQIKESQKERSTLNSTLRQLETLNKEMTRKLKKFVEERKTFLEQKDLLLVDINKQKNRLEMEKSKFDLIMVKKTHENDTLTKEVCTLKGEMEQVTKRLADKENEVKDLADELKIKRETVFNQIHRSSVSDETNKTILRQLQQHQEQCKQLQTELDCLRASQRDSGIKELSRDQSLEQLEATLHRKSAECRAIIIGKDTLQNKIQSLERENKTLQEVRRKYLVAMENSDRETKRREEVELENLKLTAQLDAMLQNVEKLSENKRNSFEQFKTLKDEVQHLTQQSQHHQQHGTAMEERMEILLEENELWKNSFNEIRDKLLNIEYEKSDEAKVHLQKHNANLRVEMICLKQTVSHMIKEYQIENKNLETVLESFKERSEKQRHTLEVENKELNEALDLLHTTLGNKEKLNSCKDSAQKSLVAENGNLQSRILTLEEQLTDLKRKTCKTQNEMYFLENENTNFQETIGKLNEKLRYLERSRRNCNCEKIQIHNQAFSAEMYKSKFNGLFTTSATDFVRYDGDGGPKSSEEDNASSKDNVSL